LGGPSANMYKMAGMKKSLCERCERPSCLFPEICVHLNYDHAPLIELYRKSALINRIKILPSEVAFVLTCYYLKMKILKRIIT
jgi:radical SAM superfamily enzyme YgiQ (UPF0313 family)